MRPLLKREIRGFLIRILLIPGIQPPGQFVPEGLQKIILVKANQADGKRLPADSKLNLFVDNFLPGIKSANELIGPAFNLKGYNIIIRNHQRSYIKVMRRDRCNNKACGLRKYDWPITT